MDKSKEKKIEKLKGQIAGGKYKTKMRSEDIAEELVESRTTQGELVKTRPIQEEADEDSEFYTHESAELLKEFEKWDEERGYKRRRTTSKQLRKRVESIRKKTQVN